MKKVFLFITLMFVPYLAMAEMVTESLDYSDGTTSMKGYIAYDNSIKGKRPGIIVVHEWWGHNEYAQRRTRMLAELGYTALALDMYGNGKTAGHPKEAGQFSGAVKKNMAVAEQRFMAAYRLLQNNKTVNAKDISAIGYCFGGGIVLEMARRGVDLDGVVSFHGSLNTNSKAQKGKVKARVLVLNGAADPFVKAETIKAFTAEMQNAGVDYEFVNYPGAKHAYTNPQADEFGKKFGIPLAYNKKADQESWQKMKKFLASLYR